jgi:hypothetical protein
MRTVTIEIPAASAPLVRRLLALHEELRALALSAPDGTVLDACETAAVEKGRDLCRQVLAEAVAVRLEAAEKRGHRSGPAPVGEPKRTAARRPASS